MRQVWARGGGADTPVAAEREARPRMSGRPHWLHSEGGAQGGCGVLAAGRRELPSVSVRCGRLLSGAGLGVTCTQVLGLHTPSQAHLLPGTGSQLEWPSNSAPYPCGCTALTSPHSVSAPPWAGANLWHSLLGIFTPLAPRGCWLPQGLPKGPGYIKK